MDTSKNKSGYDENTLKAVGNQTIYVYCTKGTGERHTQATTKIVSKPNLL